MNYSDRAKELRVALGLSQSKFGDILGLSTVQISNIEQGIRDIKVDLANKMVSEFKANPTWLITGEGEMFLPKQQECPLNGMIAVPALDVAAAAGDGVVNERESQIATFYIAEEFRQYWGVHTKAIRIYGDSMEPTIPRDGWVLVREVKEIRAEGIYIFTQNNELRCKRIQKKVNGDVIVISDNTERYEKEIYSSVRELLVQMNVIAEVLAVLKRP